MFPTSNRTKITTLHRINVAHVRARSVYEQEFDTARRCGIPEGMARQMAKSAADLALDAQLACALPN